MARIKIANVLLEDTPQFHQAPGLYVRADAAVTQVEDGAWALAAGGTFDFATFFNALSVLKWNRYTVAQGYHLHLEVKGGAGTLFLTHADAYHWDPAPIDGGEVELAASDEWRSIDLELAADPTDVLLGFTVEAEGEVLIRNGAYLADVPEDGIRPVELALCTTTFKKEEFICANIRMAKEKILGSDEPLAKHFTMHVVDNGRTLPAEELAAERVHIHANPNAGGAGGFARGMIEAGRQEPRATHVLLMDDDVQLSAESVIRTYNLLSIVNDEYSRAFLSGAMMSMDEPDMRWEDVGFMTYSGIFAPLKPPARMTMFHPMLDSETFRSRPEVPLWGDQAQSYAAWWYCCIPMSVVDEQGLPMPFFVRCDDVEYSLRRGAKLMTMNGICIWHMSFHLRYNAAVERYQTTRNTFIAQAATGIAAESDFLNELHHNVQLELKKFNYTNAELALDGFEDFLAGPERIKQPGFAEQAFMGANRRAEKLIPFEELFPMVKEQYGIDLSQLTTHDVGMSLPRPRKEAALDYVTFNGQRFAGNYIEKGSVAVIDAMGWTYQPGTMRRKETLIVIDMPNRKGAVRHIDRERFKEVWARYKRDVKEYKAKRAELEAAYAAAAPEMTSMAYWKNYLGIED